MSKNDYNIPPQKLQPYPSGASSVYQAGIAVNNQSIQKQMSLIGKTGGAIAIPPMRVSYPESNSGNNTTSNYTNGIKSIVNADANAKYDTCLGQGPSCTAALNQKAGRRRKRRTNKRKKNNKRKNTRKLYKKRRHH